jgi:alkane 1-monooxygenase
VATGLGLALLDSAFGKESRPGQAGGSAALRGVPAIYVLLQLAVTVWIGFRIAGGSISPAEAAGLTLSNGLATGVFGLSAAHELIHSRDRASRTIGLLFLASTFYMHFRISHLYGHHRRAATHEDPASARLGESLYAFLGRSVVGQVREAWAYDARRMRRAGRPVIGARNRMIVYLAIEVSILVLMVIASPLALAFLIGNAVLAIVLLETFNYVAHYGLSRGGGAAAVPLGPEHSWNSGNRMNNSALFNMGRHSDHHRHTAHPYPQLKAMPATPELPAGYAAAMLTALIPPVWRRTMDPRAMANRR